MRTSEEILAQVSSLLEAYRAGRLGGEKMPEDENPRLDAFSKENYLYFTLPMALNYQRNSYTLWECANRMYRAEEARWAFDPAQVCARGKDALGEVLVRYRVALQPNRHPAIWHTLCETIQNRFQGDIRRLFSQNDFSVEKTKGDIAAHKKEFPYLGGNKICNYWLYVLEQRTDLQFCDREAITIAPDTHVIQASVRLGLLSPEEAQGPEAQRLTAERWSRLLAGSGLVPIDLHTPLWLWSRGKFSAEIQGFERTEPF